MDPTFWSLRSLYDRNQRLFDIPLICYKTIFIDQGAMISAAVPITHSHTMKSYYKGDS